MKEFTKEKLAFFITIASIIVMVLLINIVWQQCVRQPQMQQHTTTDTVYINKKSDTIQVTKTDTLWRTKTITKTQIKPLERIKVSEGITTPSDTLNTTWAKTVDNYLYSYTYEGEDTTNENIKINYKIKATGRDVTLDTLQLNAQYAEITNNDITKILNTTETYKTHSDITSTVTTQKKHWKPYIGITVGAGIGLFTKKPDVFIGLGIVAPLYK